MPKTFALAAIGCNALFLLGYEEVLQPVKAATCRTLVLYRMKHAKKHTHTFEQTTKFGCERDRVKRQVTESLWLSAKVKSKWQININNMKEKEKKRSEYLPDQNSSIYFNIIKINEQIFFFPLSREREMETRGWGVQWYFVVHPGHDGNTSQKSRRIGRVRRVVVERMRMWMRNKLRK